MTKITKQWVDRFTPPNASNKSRKPKLVWATCFPNLLKINKKERELNDEARVVYRRPPTIGNKLTKYKQIAHLTNDARKGSSYQCGRARCKLCGAGHSNSMVRVTDTIIAVNGKKFILTKRLCCFDWGI